MKARSLLAMMLSLWLTHDLCALDKVSGKSSDKRAKSSDASGTSDAMDSAIKSIPLNARNLDVRIPGFDKNRRTSRVAAAAMTRVSDTELHGEGVTIDLFGKEPKDHMLVEMHTCIYRIDTKMLSSDERSKITRSDFTLEGDTMTFDTVASHAVLKGHVHMVIRDSSSLSSRKDGKATVPVVSPIPPAAPAK